MRISNVHVFFYSSVVILVLASCMSKVPASIAEASEGLPDKIDFNFHVKPILSDRCYSCHGPDEQSRQAELRLDREGDAFGKLASGSGRAIVKGAPGQSQLIRRILSTDPELVMPTPESHLTLSDKEKAILYKWIDQGAQWKEHWAFLPVEKPVVSKGMMTDDANELDAFIYKQLSQEGLSPAIPADKERLIRRVTMDLTGLPPTIGEIDTYLEDESPQAYERLVDGLLASKAYAERMTTEWLDVSRYADSHGMHADGARTMWPWRDWVIDAFDSNMPYDQFGIWQIAGDLLPEATKEQRLATAFNRNHTMTAEGGAIDEEFRLGYVFDRAETVSTAFLGLTTMCAKCHDHKFDPISQEDYYNLSAFFNNVREIGMTGDDGDYGPMMSLADPETEAQLAALQGEIQELETQLSKQESAELAEYLSKEETAFMPTDHVVKASYESIRKRRPSDKEIKWDAGWGQAMHDYLIDGSPSITASALNGLEEGVSGKAIRLDKDYDDFLLHDVPTYKATDQWSAAMWINTELRDSTRTQTLMGTTGEKNSFWRGWEWYLDKDNHLNAALIHNLPHNMIHARTVDTISVDEWTQVAMTYDGSMSAGGLRLYINGQASEMQVVYDKLYKNINPVVTAKHVPMHRTLKVGKSNRAFTGEYGIYEGLIDETTVYNRTLSDTEIKAIYNLHAADKLVIDKSDRQAHANHKVRYKSELAVALRDKRDDWLAISDKQEEIMVMEEMATPRTSYLYARGEYQHPSYVVQPEVLSALSPMPADSPKNRLGLANWIFAPSNPLTARVTVNRYWQMIWGTGLVDTPGDFGIQGSLPSHPDLLDWLAADFVAHGWDLKRLIKQMVMSKTYRSSSQIDKRLLEVDPDNKLLARAPTYRLPAEMIRDNALAASGLLVRQEIGGVSVKPYQPEGLWIEKSSFSHQLLNYKPDSGDSLYRRSMYTFIRRTQPHPAMIIFDQPNREICTVKRENTNTPLQALVLLNDPQFVEAAKVLAQRMQIEGGEAVHERLTYAFRLVTGRTPDDQELDVFSRLYDDQYAIYKDSIADAKALLAVGESPIDPSLDLRRTAAYAVVASTMINHDEAYTKR